MGSRPLGRTRSRGLLAQDERIALHPLGATDGARGEPFQVSLLDHLVRSRSRRSSPSCRPPLVD
eukprot:3753330-Heterocapsa_arctica.AAC.1